LCGKQGNQSVYRGDSRGGEHFCRIAGNFKISGGAGIEEIFMSRWKQKKKKNVHVIECF
jgi:hypothetical protein